MKKERIEIEDIHSHPIVMDKIKTGEINLDNFTKKDLLNLYLSENRSVEGLNTKINQSTYEDMGFEELRLKAKKELKKGYIIGAIVGVSIFVLWLIVLQFYGTFFDFLEGDFLFGIIGLSSIFPAAAIVLKYSKDEEKFKKNYKEYFVKNILDSLFDNVIYKPEEGIPEKVIENTRTVEMGSYRSNDYIEADYNGVHFIQADIDIYHDYDNGIVTCFNGRWMLFNFNKVFKANMQVISADYKFSKKFKNFRSNTLQYKKIETEDIEFNEKFKIFAQDDHDVFYILTPHMMERIKNLSAKLYGELIFFFSDNQLHIGINNFADAFETSIDSSLDLELEKQKILYDTNLITSFIKELQLDNNLFK